MRDLLEDFVKAQGGNHKLHRGFNRLGKEVRVRPAREIFEPPGRVDDIHNRSSSRTTVVSMPFTKPFIAVAGRTGTSSMRSS